MTVRVATYALDQPIPYLLERGALQTITATVRYGASGDVVVMDSATVTITRADGTAYVTDAPAVMSGGVATYDLTPASTETLGDGWIVSWTPTIGGVVYPALRSEAILGDFVIHNAINVADIYGERPELAARVPQAQGPRGTGVGWQPQVDAAYYALIRRLLSDGRPIWKIIGATGVRDWLLVEAQRRCVQAIAHGPDSTWAQASKELAYDLRRVTAGLRIRYDDDDVTTRRGMAPVIRLAPVGRPLW